MPSVVERPRVYSRVWAVVRAASVQCVGLAGFAIFIEGLREIYQPAALIAAGVCLVTWTIFKVRSGT